MLGISLKPRAKKQGSAPAPRGGAEFNVCVLDGKHAVRHLFRMGAATAENSRFVEGIAGTEALRVAEQTFEPSSGITVYGGGRRKQLYVLPYECKSGTWNFACVQVLSDPLFNAEPSPDACFFLVDSANVICTVSPHIDGLFIATAENLMGHNFSEFISEVDLSRVSSSPVDTGISVDDCVFHCLDGSRRDVVIQKFSLPYSFVLYALFDVPPPAVNTEIGDVGARERRRIGQDLHDSVGQLMTGMSLLSRSLANRLLREGNPAASDADQISTLADEASDQIRSISRGLMPSDIVQRGLFESLHELSKITTDSCGIECVSRIDESVVFGDRAVETHLYRIAQEAVNNAVRHAGASRIEISVSMDRGMPQLMVSDDGIWKVPAEDLNGIGLKTMAYRATAIGGYLTVGVNNAGGSRMVCRVVVDEGFATRI